METIIEYTNYFIQYGMPVLPYMVVALITYQITARFVKPLIDAHKTSKGYYKSDFWVMARRGMVFYPMIIGALCGAPFGLSIGYSIAAGASSQIWYMILKERLKSIGVDLPADNLMSNTTLMNLPRVNSMKPEPAADEPKEE